MEWSCSSPGSGRAAEGLGGLRWWGAGSMCSSPEYFQAGTTSGKVGPGSAEKVRQRLTEKARSSERQPAVFWTVPLASPGSLSPWCLPVTPSRSVLPKKEMHLALFRLVSLTNSTECSYVPFFYRAANFRVRFFPVLRSVLNRQGETEGRQDILSQEGEMPASTCYASQP